MENLLSSNAVRHKRYAHSRCPDRRPHDPPAPPRELATRSPRTTSCALRLRRTGRKTVRPLCSETRFVLGERRQQVHRLRPPRVHWGELCRRPSHPQGQAISTASRSPRASKRAARAVPPWTAAAANGRVDLAFYDRDCDRGILLTASHHRHVCAWTPLRHCAEGARAGPVGSAPARLAQDLPPTAVSAPACGDLDICALVVTVSRRGVSAGCDLARRRFQYAQGLDGEALPPLAARSDRSSIVSGNPKPVSLAARRDKRNTSTEPRFGSGELMEIGDPER